MEPLNKLWKVDEELFASKISAPLTHEEYNFFQNMRFKEEYEVTLSNDIIMSEDDNTMQIYIIRVNYDEYIVGCSDMPEEEHHVMNLSEALAIKLRDIGIGENDETIGEWLRSLNYKGVKYNQNFDYL